MAYNIYTILCLAVGKLVFCVVRRTILVVYCQSLVAYFSLINEVLDHALSRIDILYIFKNKSRYYIEQYYPLIFFYK